ncbi:MAG: Nif3-like dinuclear metal center hexameric protein [Bacteroidota bacterium]
MKLREITDCIEAFAPLAYQESYDNAGLICGNKNMDITSALISIDSTEEVIDEAIELGCNLVIAHHPIVFKGLKKFNGANYVERVIIKAIQHNVAIYAAHTNLDNVHNGVNAKIAQKLGLVNCRVLSPRKNILKKLITFCPSDKAENLRKALFEAGAGGIGKYDECSFNSEGFGTFRAGKGTNPFVGEIGKQHKEPEQRIETVFPNYLESKVLKALFSSHPYEEVAYDIYNLNNEVNTLGAGMIGELENDLKEEAFLAFVKEKMHAHGIRYTALRNKLIKKVAICGGSGSFLLEDAIKAGADIFVSADFKYHQFFDAENRIIIADIGHYESEQYTMELFSDLLKENFNTFALHLSKINTNPINYL